MTIGLIVLINALLEVAKFQFAKLTYTYAGVQIIDDLYQLEDPPLPKKEKNRRGWSASYSCF